MLLRDASRTPMFLGLDARCAMLVFPAFLFINLWSMLYVVAMITLFVILRVNGVQIEFAYRRLLSKLRGNLVESRPWWFIKGGM